MLTISIVRGCHAWCGEFMARKNNAHFPLFFMSVLFIAVLFFIGVIGLLLGVEIEIIKLILLYFGGVLALILIYSFIKISGGVK